jgi:hydroxyacylglutathione hydrolase
MTTAFFSRKSVKYSFLVILLSILLLIAFLVSFSKDFAKVQVENQDIKITQLSVDFANIYIIERDNKILMIDSGNPGHEKRVEALLSEQGINPGEIDYLILTHGHLDHSGTANYFRQHYGIKTIGHIGDNDSFSLGHRNHTCPTSSMAGFMKSLKSQVKITPFTVDRLIDSELDLAELGVRGKITPWPGHTKGSVIVQFDSYVFVGDLIAGEIFNPTKPMTHFFMCDLEDNKKKINTLLQRPNIDTWFLGHFGPLTPINVTRFVKK